MNPRNRPGRHCMRHRCRCTLPHLPDNHSARTFRPCIAKNHHTRGPGCTGRKRHPACRVGTTSHGIPNPSRSIDHQGRRTQPCLPRRWRTRRRCTPHRFRRFDPRRNPRVSRTWCRFHPRTAARCQCQPRGTRPNCCTPDPIRMVCVDIRPGPVPVLPGRHLAPRSTRIAIVLPPMTLSVH